MGFIEASEGEQLAAARAGDRAAFAALVNAQYDFVYRTAYKWCGNREDAEDVTQDVCIKLATAIRDFDGRSALRSWLYRVVLNAVRDRQRQSARRGRQVKALAEVTPESLAPEQESAMAGRQIWEAVRGLPDNQRDAVLLVYGEDRSHAEAAAIMGSKESTVSWYIHEAKKVLKGLI